MGALRGGIAIWVALGLLVACNAMTGADTLSIGSTDPDEARIVSNGSSSHDSGARSDGGASSSSSNERTPRDPLDDASSPPPTQTDAGFDATTTMPPGFTDLFERPDSPTVGNGWLEKTDHFAIAAGAVLQSGSGNYKNLIVTRPEILLDVQTSIEIVYRATKADPALYARVQPASDTPNELLGYTFYAYRDYAAIDRQGSNGSRYELASVRPSLVVGVTYRLVFRVTGTAPVRLEATILAPDGSAAATLSALDSADQRIRDGGRVGFGSGDGDGLRYDNFVRVDL